MAVQFTSEAQKNTYDKVSELLRDEFGRQAAVHNERPIFYITAGSAYVTIAVEALGEKESVVRALSWVVTGAETTPELTKYLLNANQNFRFGAYAMDDVGDILFTHAFYGENLSRDALLYTVYGVARVADDSDDQIVQRFGGQRGVDRK